jgi:glycine cleavage system aminomethyltransferase T
MAKDDFVGKASLEHAPPSQKTLHSIVFHDPTAVVLGKEPVYLAADSSDCIGYVTSAAYSATIGHCIAYAWLPTGTSPGDVVAVDYRGSRYGATVHAEPVVDPDMSRIRR